MTVRIKICGLTRPDDARTAGLLGADAVGLNFYRGPRKITLPQALPILEALPPMVPPVALVEHIDRADPLALSAAELQQALALRTFQTYSSTEQFRLPVHLNDHLDWWAVVPVISPSSIANLRGLLATFNSPPQGIVLDTYVPGSAGGTGQSFNWHWIADARHAGQLDNLPPIILAGGLTPDNVADAVRIARPYAVDVSSGVEPPNSPGLKDPARMKAFIQAVRSVEK